MSEPNPMSQRAYLSAVLHGLHVTVSSAASAAHAAFGRDAAVTYALRDLSQLMLALHDGDGSQAEARVREFTISAELMKVTTP